VVARRMLRWECSDSAWDDVCVLTAASCDTEGSKQLPWQLRGGDCSINGCN
jgi:hypothetical protein